MGCKPSKNVNVSDNDKMSDAKELLELAEKTRTELRQLQTDINQTVEDGAKLIEQLPTNKNVDVPMIPQLDEETKNNFIKLSGTVDAKMILSVAQDIDRVKENRDDLLSFPEKAVILSTLVQIVAINENKCNDENYLASYIACEKARLCQNECDILTSVDEIKNTFEKIEGI